MSKSNSIKLDRLDIETLHEAVQLFGGERASILEIILDAILTTGAESVILTPEKVAS
ncbi:hypothetical protein M2337_003409 [Sphingobium sp. B2D3A]|uniref:hypothetical protein n=1 Tax=unclassified Sphingobium TaxID=2611147 RepID=UPI0022247012|nr:MULTISPECIES: hypothetical protein [unclassified Sphingobium]MCW2339119.1 hypothetical protein [Sphingobium sp. B2D3A]MCW2386938.1 hypothetical protein [Sphingobium sp. B2D3D]